MIIEIENLQKIFRTDELETTALNNINLQVKEGEFLSIMGASGCGKSTLLNILGMIDGPSGGAYKFMGQDIAKYNEKQRADLRKQNIGFVFQSFNLIDELTVQENVELPLVYSGMASSQRKARVKEVLDRMQMSHRSKHFPQQLSGGQQQRVAVARAIANQPKVIFADEPTGNLDSANGTAVMQLLSELNESGTTIIMVTHSPADAQYGHRIIQLSDGKIISENKTQPNYV